MSEQRPFRRLGRADRKREIKGDSDFLKKDIPDDLPDLSMLTGDDYDEVDQLASIPQGVIAKPLKIAPPEQRYPPISAPEEAADEHTRPADYLSQGPPKPPRRTGLNILTLLLLLGTVGIWYGVSLIWQDPYVWLNPLPPPVVRVFVTATFLPPTPTPNLPPTQEGSLGFGFGLAGQGVEYRANDNGRNCEWASIAGGVTDNSGVGLNGYRVQIVGEDVNTTVFTGTAQAFGPGGFEFPLGSVPVEQAFIVQLLNLDSQPLSDIITVQTRATCEENVVVLQFRPQ